MAQSGFAGDGVIRDIARFEKGEYDLIVVGGGINGAAIANISSDCQLKVALLEKGDFAGGTSSKSTKLIHGGIRYLEHFEFDLVRESLRERFIQLKSVPHLVKPLPFIIPVYKNDKRPLWMMKLGVWLYDFLSGKYAIGWHRSLSPNEVFALAPSLNQENLLGAVMYYDAQMDDARLCLENVLSACQKGAHVANYVEVTGFLKENGKVTGVEARDLLGKRNLTIRARKTICATGPWTNQLLKLDHPSSRKKVRLTKGVHLVYPGQLSLRAFLLTSRRDKRIFFVIPWMGNSLIGTTDTDYTGDPDVVEARPEDIQYLLREARRFFPAVDFKEEKILKTFAGLRSLLRKAGAPSDVSRKHVIEESFSGIFFVIGGKYTTYRKIARDCVERIWGSLRNSGRTRAGLTPARPHFFQSAGGPHRPACQLEKYLAGRRQARPAFSEYYPLYGSGEISESPQAAADRFGLSAKTVTYLMEKYGTRYLDVLTLTQNHPELKNPICSCSPAIGAQIVYSIETEMAQTPEDIIHRRLGLGYLRCSTKECEKVIRSHFLS